MAFKEANASSYVILPPDIVLLRNPWDRSVAYRAFRMMMRTSAAYDAEQATLGRRERGKQDNDQNYRQ